MKGVILAGGLGTRLRPLTQVTNKHLLPVYDRPMVCFPIATLVNASIRDILIVTGGEHAGDFLRLLGNGRHLGVRHLEYTYQEGEGGIADALRRAEEFAEGGRICVVLGDNIVERGIGRHAAAFERQGSGAKILIKEVPDPERFGVVRFAGEGPGSGIREIVEKPASPPSRFAVTGIYFYDASCFAICAGLQPSARGELEITAVNNAYLARGDLTCDVLDGWWTDAGTFESLFRASELVRRAGGAAGLDRAFDNPAAGGGAV
jgi:glucose-1-phosphate thymidylyltransferase